MPLPADLVTVTVTATYEAIDGSLASGGSVTFDAGGIITDNAGRYILGEPATVPVVNGQIAVTLPATDNTALNPVDFTYTVTEEITGWAARTYQIALPSSFAPSIDLSQMAPATAPSQPPDPSQQAAGDLSGPWANPVVTRTHLAYPMPVEQGGTGQDTALTYTDVGADQAGAAADALTQAQEYTDAETAQLASQIAAASGLAVTAGSTPPPDPSPDDLWINTSAGNTLEQWDGTAWVPYQFGLAALAPDVTSAIGSKSQVTMGPAIPSSASPGDLWIQTSAATGIITAILQCTRAYTSGGTLAANWAIESATSARALGAPYTYQQASAPSTANNSGNPPQVNDLWINTAAGNVIEQMTGGTSASPEWTPFQIGLAALGTDAVAAINSKAKASLGSSVPPSASAGDLWIQTNSASTSITGVYTCTTAYASGGTAANWSTEALTARAIGAPFAYQQASAPSAAANPSNPPQLNDLWINTGAGNVINQMTGGTPASPVWTQFQLGTAAIAPVTLGPAPSAVAHANSGAAVTSFSAPCIAAVPAGTNLIVGVGGYTASTAAQMTVTDSAGTRYTLAGSSLTSGEPVWIFQGQTAAALTTSSTITAATDTSQVLNIIAVQVPASGAADVYVKNNGNSTSPSVATGPLGYSPEYVIAFSHNATNTPAWQAPAASLATTSGGGGGFFSAGYIAAGSKTGVTAAVTQSTATAWTIAAVSVLPATGIGNAQLAPGAVGKANIQPDAVGSTQISDVDGGLINDGSIPVSAVGFTAADIGGNAVTVSAAPPGSPNDGDLWLDAANGYLLNQYSAAAGTWTPYPLGTNAFAAGSVTAGLLAARAVAAGMIDVGALDGLTINAPVINGATMSATDLLVSGVNGGVYAYGPGGGGPVVQTYTTSGTFTPSTGITQVKVEAIAGGGNGSAQSSGAGAGGGAGEYAAETKLTVVPGQAYTVTVGAANQASSFSGSGATTVTAHAGGNASGATPGTGGTGSSNSIHYPGGKGGAPSTGAPVSATYTGQSGTWTCPAGVTSITVQAWGPGSGGWGGSTSGNGGSGQGGIGGCGGAYASKTLPVTPGTAYPFAAGTGGAGGSANTAGSDASGPATFGGGLVVADYATGLRAGQASASTGTSVYSGGGSGNGSSYYSATEGGAGGGGGSSAGTSANGNYGTSASQLNAQSVAGGAAPAGGAAGGGSGWGGSGPTAGSAGGTPGAGGGGGGANGTTAKAGGKGGDGRIVITYVSPSNAGGGGGGASGGVSAAGNAGAAGNGAAGGAGGTAVTGGGPGGAGGASSASGASPAAVPGGGGGGAGSGGTGAAGSRGQVRITYQGTSGLVASIAGAPGSDPVTQVAAPAGYMGQVTAIQPGSSPVTAETWHSLPTPSGWTAGGAGPTGVRYKKAAENGVWVQAALTNNTGVSGTVDLGSMPAGYIPASNTLFPIRIYVSSTPATTEYTGSVDTTGDIQARNLPAGDTNISFCQWIPLD